MDGPPALADPRLAGIRYEVVNRKGASSLAEAAAMQGDTPDALLKTMMVRVSDARFIMVLVPGNRTIDWHKLRSLLGERRLTMATPEQALDQTGYTPGTITPFGSNLRFEVYADAAIGGRVTVGSGEHGVGIRLDAAELLRVVNAKVDDLTKPSG